MSHKRVRDSAKSRCVSIKSIIWIVSIREEEEILVSEMLWRNELLWSTCDYNFIISSSVMLTWYRIHHLIIVLTFPHSWMDFHLFELIPNSVKYILTKQDISTEKGPFLGPVDDSSPITIKPYLLISYLCASHSIKWLNHFKLYHYNSLWHSNEIIFIFIQSVCLLSKHCRGQGRWKLFLRCIRNELQWDRWQTKVTL